MYTEFIFSPLTVFCSAKKRQFSSIKGMKMSRGEKKTANKRERNVMGGDVYSEYERTSLNISVLFQPTTNWTINIFF